MLKAAPLTPTAGYSYVSGVQIRELPDPGEPAPLPKKPNAPVTAHVEALVNAIEQACVKGMLSAWPVVDLFPFWKLHHWAAFAREAGVPVPDQATRRAVRSAYRARVGYAGPLVTDDTVDE